MSGIDKVCNGSSVTKMKPASPDLALVNYCATILMQGGTHEQIKQHLNEHQNGLSEDVLQRACRQLWIILRGSKQPELTEFSSSPQTSPLPSTNGQKSPSGTKTRLSLPPISAHSNSVVSSAS